MRKICLRGALLFSLLAVVLVSIGGCSKEAPKDLAQGKTANAESNKKDHSSAWWCDEHGMPEGICAQCSAKLSAEFKKKGDWCKEHDRPESQCFICHPELKEKFAALYRTKYGKEPPPMEEEKATKKDDKK
jgi:hypothetical protein